MPKLLKGDYAIKKKLSKQYVNKIHMCPPLAQPFICARKTSVHSNPIK